MTMTMDSIRAAFRDPKEYRETVGGLVKNLIEEAHAPLATNQERVGTMLVVEALQAGMAYAALRERMMAAEVEEQPTAPALRAGAIPHDLPISEAASWLLEQSSRDYRQHEIDALRAAAAILYALEGGEA